MQPVTTMKSLLSALALLAALAAGRPAFACQWFGTQLECDLGGSQVVIGTQATDQPQYARTFQPQSFHGDGVLPGARERIVRTFQVRLQDIGTDPGLCRRIGNETYCY